MKTRIIPLLLLAAIAAASLTACASKRQTQASKPLTSFSRVDNVQEIHYGTLSLGRRGQEVFGSGDSVLVLRIDTLIMKDRSSLHFFGTKKIIMEIGHAEIGERVYFWGTSKENDASDFDIDIQFATLGSLYVMANGRDAMNGTRTNPNGHGGDVCIRYRSAGLKPQEENRRDPNYLYVDVSGGGRHVNPDADLKRIYDQIRHAGAGLRGVPQGQVYFGTPGNDGTVKILEID